MASNDHLPNDVPPENSPTGSLKHFKTEFPVPPKVSKEDCADPVKGENVVEDDPTNPPLSMPRTQLSPLKGQAEGPPRDTDSERTPTADYSFETPDDDLLPGNMPRMMGKFEVVGVLGAGAMGIVYKAVAPDLNRIVAIKSLRNYLAASKTARQRFLREASAAAGVHHPNIVVIHDVNKDEPVPFIVMEYLDGPTLQQYIQKNGTLSPIQAIRLSLQIAEGLAAAHAHGIIHRDIKPGNIVLDSNLNSLKITDFGLARVQENNSDLTSQGVAMGTPAYMSPEQVRCEKLDFRSDLFSLGCVMHAMIAGQSPFRGQSSLEVSRKVTELTPPPLHEINPETPLFLSQLIQLLLEKDPARRPQSAAAVAEDLKHFLALLNSAKTDEIKTILKQGLVSEVASARPGPSAFDPDATLVPEPTAQVFRGRFSLAGGRVVLSLLVVTAILGGTLSLWKPGTGPQKDQVVTDPSGAGEGSQTALPVEVVNAGQPGAQVTVGPQGADFTSLTAALEFVGPDSTIQILGAGTYAENLTIDSADQWRNLSILSAEHAELKVENSQPLLFLANTPGVKISGLKISNVRSMPAIRIQGDCTGCVLEYLKIDSPNHLGAPVLEISGGAHGSAEAPLQIRNCTLHAGDFGCSVYDATRSPIEHLQFHGNLFLIDKPGAGHLQLYQSIRHVELKDNMFVRGIGLSCFLPEVPTEMDLSIVNNTYSHCDHWMSLNLTSPELTEVHVVNNLILQTGPCKVGANPLESFAGKGWNFAHNYWTPPAGVNPDVLGVDGIVAVLLQAIELSDNRPEVGVVLPHPDAAIAKAGLGAPFASYVGAIPPGLTVSPEKLPGCGF
jgi:serine/threonine protein kinase